MNPMSATVRAIFYSIAVLCFLGAALGARHDKVRVDLVGAGLLFFVFVSAWDAWALS